MCSKSKSYNILHYFQKAPTSTLIKSPIMGQNITLASFGDNVNTLLEAVRRKSFFHRSCGPAINPSLLIPHALKPLKVGTFTTKPITTQTTTTNIATKKDEAEQQPAGKGRQEERQQACSGREAPTWRSRLRRKGKPGRNGHDKAAKVGSRSKSTFLSFPSAEEAADVLRWLQKGPEAEVSRRWWGWFWSRTADTEIC